MSPARSLVFASLLIAAITVQAIRLTSDADASSRSPRSREWKAMSAERRGIAVVSGAAAVCPAPCEPLRSLIVTEEAILRHFSFREVMERVACPTDLGCPAHEAPARALALFHQWWDTQNVAGPGTTLKCAARMFGFPYECPRREEGAQATYDPFKDTPPGSEYLAIGLFNRIDLADPDGRDCGEYRVVFARRSGMRRSGERDDEQRLLINFEAVLPNPQPDRKLAGCKVIAEFWHRLSHPDWDEARRAKELYGFYFDGLQRSDGLPRLRPVVHVENYGARECLPDAPCPTGQIRTNQRMREPWTLREYRVERNKRTGVVRIMPDTVKDNPAAELFSPRGATSAFRDAFLKMVPTLARRDRDALCYGIDDHCGHSPDRFNPGDSPVTVASDYAVQFDRTGSLAMAIQRRLKDTPVSNVDHLINRAQALSCAGCHELSNIEEKRAMGAGEPWPLKTKTFRFVHVTEQHMEGSGPARRYMTSEALTEFSWYRRTKLGYVLDQR